MTDTDPRRTAALIQARAENEAMLERRAERELLKRLELVATIADALGSHELTEGLKVREAHDLAAHIAKALRTP